MEKKLRVIPGGKKGTKETIKIMREFALKDSLNPNVITKARQIIIGNNIDPRDEKAIADCMFSWMKKYVKFCRDPLTAEMVQSPKITLKLKSGDCDDHSTLFSCLNLCVGNLPRFVTIGRQKDHFSHVYTQIKTSGGWISYDTVVPTAHPGWEGENPQCKRVWFLSGEFVDVNMGDSLSDDFYEYAQSSEKEEYVDIFMPEMDETNVWEDDPFGIKTTSIENGLLKNSLRDKIFFRL